MYRLFTISVLYLITVHIKRRETSFLKRTNYFCFGGDIYKVFEKSEIQRVF